MIDWKKISAGTVTRSALLLVSLINMALTALGISPLPIEQEGVTELISVLFTIVTAVVAWWKNNSFTKEAIEADKYLVELQEGGIH